MSYLRRLFITIIAMFLALSNASIGVSADKAKDIREELDLLTKFRSITLDGSPGWLRN